MTKDHISALAYPSWYCYNIRSDGFHDHERGTTQAACDKYENKGTPGVKYSGSYYENVRTI
jgi:hypothetical protein